jgi:hypothetical protein
MKELPRSMPSQQSRIKPELMLSGIFYMQDLAMNLNHVLLRRLMKTISKSNGERR